VLLSPPSHRMAVTSITPRKISTAPLARRHTLESLTSSSEVKRFICENPLEQVTNFLPFSNSER
jgi:hypothetical protein